MKSVSRFQARFRVAALLIVITSVAFQVALATDEQDLASRWSAIRDTGRRLSQPSASGEKDRRRLLECVRNDARLLLDEVQRRELRSFVSQPELEAAAECAEYCEAVSEQVRLSREAVSRYGDTSESLFVLVRGLGSDGQIEEAAGIVDRAVGNLGMRHHAALLYGQVFHGYRRRGDYGAAQVALEKFFSACSTQMLADSRICFAVVSNLNVAKENSLYVGGVDRWRACTERLVAAAERAVGTKDTTALEIDFPSTSLGVLVVYIELERALRGSAVDGQFAQLTTAIANSRTAQPARSQQLRWIWAILQKLESTSTERFPLTKVAVGKVILDFEGRSEDEKRLFAGCLQAGRRWVMPAE